MDDDICLCDSPGLVFPSFVNTKAEMICSGILPIDQMRDPLSPVALVSSHSKVIMRFLMNPTVVVYL